MSRSDFTTIRVVGGLLPTDVLARVLAGDKNLGGLTGPDYHLPSGETPREAANRAWPYLLGAWAAFRQALAKLPEGDPAVGITREKWLTVLFKELDYGRLPTTPAGGLVVDDKTFPVSHLWGATPLHLLGWGVDLDKRTKGVPGAAERAPQAMVQELLNRTDQYLWAMLSNGRTIRLLRDSTSLAGQAYVEFDLESMFDGEVFSDFVLLYLLLHQSRVEVPTEGVPADCWLEKWRTAAAESGTRALGLLRDGVKDAIEALGTGFLQANGNDLNTRLADGTLRIEDYHRSLLRLVYRLLFLFVAEDRGLLHEPHADPAAVQRYRDYYSTARLREVARKRRGSRHTDLWAGLQIVLKGLATNGGRPELALPGLGGLFTDEPIDVVTDAALRNVALLTALRKLSVVHPKGSPPRVIDYRNLGAEELGSIYESLLELVPRHDQLERTFTLELLAGNDRKTSGSYYTPSSLIDLVLDEALDPILDEKERQQDAEAALLGITVCDPACGSGHFLVAAARRIATRLAAVRTGEVDPTPTDVQHALHDVVARCIYGVDLNPMAAELAKVSLWLEAMEAGRPLSFLDAHIKVGNALLGATPKLLADGIPDAAFDPIEGDDKKYAASLKKRNKAEREASTGPHQQEGLFDETVIDVSNAHLRARYADALAASLQATSLDQVNAAEQRYREAQESPEARRARLTADTWCAAFVQHQVQGALPITQTAVEQASAGALSAEAEAEIDRLASNYRFFHWNLEFPEVFMGQEPEPTREVGGLTQVAGFSAVVGNPPYLDSESMVRAQQRTRKAIESLWGTARGNWDLYVPFVELASAITRGGGRHAMVTPSTILGAPYVSGLQDALLRYTVTSIHDLSEERLFDGAAVAVSVVHVLKVHQSDDSDSTTRIVNHNGQRAESHLLPRSHMVRRPKGFKFSSGLTSDLMSGLRWTLGDLAKCSDGATTSEAYLIREVVAEAENVIDQVRLVNTGTIDPFAVLWGKREATYLGFKSCWPVVPAVDLERIAPVRLQQARLPKVLVAGIGRTIEAVADITGQILCGKSAVLILPKSDVCPFALAAYLNCSVVSAEYRGMFGNQGLGKSMNFGPKQVAQIPVPPPEAFRPDLSQSSMQGDENLEELISMGAPVLSRVGRMLHEHMGFFGTFTQEYLDRVVTLVIAHWTPAGSRPASDGVGKTGCSELQEQP